MTQKIDMQQITDMYKVFTIMECAFIVGMDGGLCFTPKEKEWLDIIREAIVFFREYQEGYHNIENTYKTMIAYAVRLDTIAKEIDSQHMPIYPSGGHAPK